MKISVIVGGRGTWHTDRLREEAEKIGVGFELVNVKSLNSAAEQIANLGEVVFWRSSSLDIGVSRTTFLQMLRKKWVVNRAVGETPLVTHKLYQQKMVEGLRGVSGIKTYQFRDKAELLAAVENGELCFPLIMKKDLSARGRGVRLLKNLAELKKVKIDFKKYIFQKFVPNDGDFRVLVMGGIPLGVIKRVGKEGEFRNNVSLGGVAEDMKDHPDAEIIKGKAVLIASLFNLAFCGVDLIFDQEEGVYRFLEVNTVAQWQGFQTATGVNVASELVKYFVSVARRGFDGTRELVSDYYEDFYQYLSKRRKFHLDSRLWLLNKDALARKRLDIFRDTFVGSSPEEREAILVYKIGVDDEEENDDEERDVGARAFYYEKHPLLAPANRVLFWWLMAKKLYRTDLTDLVRASFPEKDLVDLRNDLAVDKESAASIYTSYINYCYLLAEYLGEPSPDPGCFVDLMKDVLGAGVERKSIRGAIYLATHCVIGASLFYTRKVETYVDIYSEMIREVEKLILIHYFIVSLDMKMEFLVCCRLLSYRSFLTTIIAGEADKSLSLLGNFLVDTLNEYRHRLGNKFRHSEHRNVLYLTSGL